MRHSNRLGEHYLGKWHLVTRKIPSKSISRLTSGKSIWRLTLQPHPWSQEVADLVWEGLETYEVTEETEAPTRRIAKTGWECGLVVEIGY